MRSRRRNVVIQNYYAPSGGGSSGDWILATGLWNDSGIWDDSANWID